MKKIYSLLAAMLISLPIAAANEQTITVNGFQVDKVVKVISFEGDDLVLTYTDDTSEREDMELVFLAFTYDGSATGIQQPTAQQGEKVQQVYTLSGVAVGKSLQGFQPGVYIVKGKKVLIK